MDPAIQPITYLTHYFVNKFFCANFTCWESHLMDDISIAISSLTMYLDIDMRILIVIIMNEKERKKTNFNISIIKTLIKE